MGNIYIEGRSLHEISEFLNRGFTYSRLKCDDIIQMSNGEIVVHKGDGVPIICAEADAEIIKNFGYTAELPWIEEEKKQPIISKRVVITSPSIDGKIPGKMCLSSACGVSITRIIRQGADLFTTHDLYLHVGDCIMMVSHEENVNHVECIMDNSM